jgi:hypothetical protein
MEKRCFIGLQALPRICATAHSSFLGHLILTTDCMRQMSSQLHSKGITSSYPGAHVLRRRPTLVLHTTTSSGWCRVASIMGRSLPHVCKGGAGVESSVSSGLLSMFSFSIENTVLVCITDLLTEHPDLPSRLYPEQPEGVPGPGKCFDKCFDHYLLPQ